MIEDNLTVPFGTIVLGVPVTVREVELTVDGRIVARCVGDGVEQRISLLDLPLPDTASRRCGVGRGVSAVGGSAGQVSAYQYYEFAAVDRPLDDRQLDELRTLSTRA